MSHLFEGDSFQILPRIPTASVDFILTDPPYNLSQSDKELLHNEFLRICKGDIIVFSPPENQWVFPDARFLFWVKATSTKNYSRSYGRFVEMLFWYRRGEVWNTNLNWSNYVGVYDDKVVGLSGHPFEKPLSLLERFILIHTNPGDMVCDPFAGSGNALKIAKRLGRR